MSPNNDKEPTSPTLEGSSSGGIDINRIEHVIILCSPFISYLLKLLLWQQEENAQPMNPQQILTEIFQVHTVILSLAILFTLVADKYLQFHCEGLDGTKTLSLKQLYGCMLNVSISIH